MQSVGKEVQTLAGAKLYSAIVTVIIVLVLKLRWMTGLFPFPGAHQNFFSVDSVRFFTGSNVA
jgi:hypothetical protein